MNATAVLSRGLESIGKWLLFFGLGCALAFGVVSAALGAGQIYHGQLPSAVGLLATSLVVLATAGILIRDLRR